MMNLHRFGHLILILALAIALSCTGGRQPGPAGGDGPNEAGGDGGDSSAAPGGPSGSMGEEGEIATLSRGVRVWLNAGCTSCHRIGDDPGGDVGPSLTGVGDRLSKDEIKRRIRSPKDVDPNATMPPQDLGDEDLEYLARYLSILSSDTAK